jgi:predicted enzyme related to lactoylglutathione lyase
VDTPDRKTVTVVARDVIQAGCEGAAWPALDRLAKDVHRHEPLYLLVDDLAAVIVRAEDAGGKQHMPPTDVDGYHSAMIQDPEGNPIGLITPFDN